MVTKMLILAFIFANFVTFREKNVGPRILAFVFRSKCRDCHANQGIFLGQTLPPLTL